VPGIGFRPLEADDLQQVFLWLLKPHVTKWYSPEPSSFMECVAKYGPRTREGNAVRAFIVLMDDMPIGYIQTYAIATFPDYEAQLACEPGVAGMDLFIGEESFLHRGFGPDIMTRFVDEIVFAGDAAQACIAGPAEGNRESIRAFEKAGFRRWKTVRIDDRQVECVMRRERDAARYRLVPIDLERDGEACVAFRRASFVASFGSEAGLDAEMGPQSVHYLGQLRARIAQVPEGNAHLREGERIVGQAEMLREPALRRAEPSRARAGPPAARACGRCVSQARHAHDAPEREHAQHVGARVLPQAGLGHDRHAAQPGADGDPRVRARLALRLRRRALRSAARGRASSPRPLAAAGGR
jgi:RimJ/RimL family protein N-acetyltransferase